jgi:hypothetical protein
MINVSLSTFRQYGKNGEIFMVIQEMKNGRTLLIGDQNCGNTVSRIILLVQPELCHLFLEGIPADAQICGR